MKKTILFLCLLTLTLNACSGSASATPEVTLQNVYTAAAMTLSVQANTPAATVTTIPTLALPTMQLLPTSNTVLPTASAPSLISYSTGSTANGCNNALYVSDVTIADGTVLAAGESFTKTWEFQNNGICAWSEDYLITFVSGSQMSGEATEIDQTVATGAAGDISVTLVAPTTVGTFTGYWRLADADGGVFGQAVYVQIVVSSSPTNTATTTTTTESEEATSTPPATTQPTAIPTDTPVPTSAPTETPTTIPSE